MSDKSKRTIDVLRDPLAAKPTGKTEWFSFGDGLHLCITAKGAKTWYFKKTENKVATQIKIGRLEDFTTEEAKKVCKSTVIVSKKNSLKEDFEDWIAFRQSSKEYSEDTVLTKIKFFERLQKHLNAKGIYDFRKLSRSVAIEVFKEIGKEQKEKGRKTYQKNCWILLNGIMTRIMLRDDSFTNPLAGIKRSEVIGTYAYEQHKQVSNLKRFREIVELAKNYQVTGTYTVKPFEAKRYVVADMSKLPESQREANLFPIKSHVRKSRKGNSQASKDIFLALIYSARRLSEMLLLKWENIFEEEMYFEITIDDNKMGYKNYRFPITPKLKEIFDRRRKIKDEYRVNTEFVFFHPENGKKFSDEIVNELRKNLGIDKELNTHGIRGSFKTIMMYQRIPEEYLEHCLGHRKKDAYITKDFSPIDIMREVFEKWEELIG